MAKTVSEEYVDATLRRAINIRRYTAAQQRELLKLLEKADAELTAVLRTRLATFVGKTPDFTTKRYKALLDEIRKARTDALKAYKDTTRSSLQSLARDEHDAELAILKAVIPFEVSFAAADALRLRAIATSQPFQGRFLKDWFEGLERADRARIQQQLQLGLIQGDSVDQIVRRFVGTRAAGYTDGVMAVTRRDAIAIARTAINHVSNEARAMVWDENEGFFDAEVWTSVLDGRTTASCRARDGLANPVGDNPLPEELQPLVPAGIRPPGHFQCRSIMVAYINGLGLLGNRPTITDTRTRRAREIDFRKEARQSKQSIKDVRAQWAAENIGRVSAPTSYQEWLSGQPAAFQDSVLGKAKGKLFRSGGLKLDQFVDKAGNELTLAQLRQSDPAAFVRAGLDPNTP